RIKLSVNSSPISGPHLTRAGQSGGMIPTVHSVLAVYFLQRKHALPTNERDGVSTYLALTFGTLLSSQGTDASFGIPSGLPPGASLRSFLYFVFLTLSDPFGVRFPVRRGPFVSR